MTKSFVLREYVMKYLYKCYKLKYAYNVSLGTVWSMLINNTMQGP